MFVVGTHARSVPKRRFVRGVGVDAHKSEWMESGQDPLLSPTIFLVEQSPNCTAATHFHRQNQFQLFVEGDGALGPNPLRPVSVHYAGAYTGYGPLSSGPQGLKYFTIRPVYDTGVLSAVEDRSQMKRGPKRHATGAPIVLASPEQLAALAGPQVTDAIAIAEDGLGARVLSVPPQTAISSDFPPASIGAFMVVLTGSLVSETATFNRWESMFASTPRELPKLTSGPEGAQVIFLFTPATEAAYLPAANMEQP